MSAFLIVSAVQGAAILFDEFFFHRKRGLPKWEVIGHPIDTMTVIACLLFLAFMERTPTTEIIYYVMATISCICVTKDEWVHRKFCSAEEMWLHAVLFMMHPLSLFVAMYEWEDSRAAFVAVAGGVFVFLVYQVVYWGFLAERIRKARVEASYRKVQQENEGPAPS
ncbi:hypothetical protein AZI87_08525 [Bdellovibrio bacteriovorus]|uniref:Uncharacterized protein n=1 Tax=Bdellovibrio bacteriovorus TaxID=959 RepID=A0A162GYK1_BDEBC|nr:hypothetical protein [Bdellovibrio bacteriovorus]KYG69240.1 hypothetical protein AZI87_08525 [Bdellovibrio bacteriovorus]